jgi:hypothetical protein
VTPQAATTAMATVSAARREVVRVGRNTANPSFDGRLRRIPDREARVG